MTECLQNIQTSFRKREEREMSSCLCVCVQYYTSMMFVSKREAVSNISALHSNVYINYCPVHRLSAFLVFLCEFKYKHYIKISDENRSEDIHCWFTYMAYKR